MSLPDLPYHKADLAPHISEETFDFHYGKHHQAYITKLVSLIKDTPKEKQSLTQILLNSDGPTFNNAAQHWNHSFYWNSMSPKKDQPSGQIKNLIVQKWGSVDKFKQQFSTNALNNFGSGWTWLVRKGQKEIGIVNTSNAGNPLKDKFQPLLTVDIWQHAYYIDYRNARAKYLQNFCQIINWKFVQSNYNNPKSTYKWQNPLL